MTCRSRPRFSAASWKASACERTRETINYEERAPLVIPPSRDSAAAGNDPTPRSPTIPAWPKDPDVQRRKAEAAQERAQSLSISEQMLRDESRAAAGRNDARRRSREAARRAPTARVASSPLRLPATRCRRRSSATRAICSSKMFGKDRRRKQPLHRRAAADRAHRAAARLSDAVAGSALRPRQGEGGRSDVARLREEPSGGRTVSRYVWRRALVRVAVPEPGGRLAASGRV